MILKTRTTTSAVRALASPTVGDSHDPAEEQGYPEKAHVADGR